MARVDQTAGCYAYAAGDRQRCGTLASVHKVETKARRRSLSLPSALGSMDTRRYRVRRLDLRQELVA